LRGIENWVKEGLFTCVANTATQSNLDEASKLIKLTERLGAKRFLAFNFIPVGRGEDVVDIDLTPEQRELFLETLIVKSISEETKIETLSTAPQYARVSLELPGGETVAPTHFYIGHAAGWLSILAEFIGGCGAGRIYCGLQPNGDITPCVFMPRLVVGNLRETPFLNICRNSEIMKSLRDRSLLKGRCGNCEYKYVCGGCRARALAYFNDLFAPDPGCILTKEQPVYSQKNVELLNK
jgi:radical SAM protein with 4Fe4S-binding SPASM domain